MAQPRIKRYALVPDSRPGALRSFQLARVATGASSAGWAERLERMEGVAERDRARENGSAGPPRS